MLSKSPPCEGQSRGLGSQPVDSEVLLVEARQYTDGKVMILVPTLFGYTERAVQVKQRGEEERGKRKKWDWEMFLAHARDRLDASKVDILSKLYAALQPTPLSITWGTGSRYGSFNLKYERILPKSFITIQSDGRLYFNSTWYKGNEEAEAFRDELKRKLSEGLGLPVPNDYREKFCEFRIETWGPKADALVSLLGELLSQRENRGA